VVDGTILCVESLSVTFFKQVWGHLLQGTRHDFDNLPKDTSARLSYLWLNPCNRLTEDHWILELRDHAKHSGAFLQASEASGVDLPKGPLQNDAESFYQHYKTLKTFLPGLERPQVQGPGQDL
jgi:hypothetical protein